MAMAKRAREAEEAAQTPNMFILTPEPHNNFCSEKSPQAMLDET